MAHQNTFAGNPLDRAGDLRNDPDWLAEQVGPDEDFLVAFKVDDAHFMVVGRTGGQPCERLCAVEPAQA